MELKNLTYDIENDVALIGFGKYETKSMNTLSEECLKELNYLVDQVAQDKKSKELKGLIFFSHKEDCFLAGADIKMIASLTTESEGAKGAMLGQELFSKIEDLDLYKVACVDGVCLGGGLELAMSCNQILVSDSRKTKLGLPEVQLGIIPGFGGTYRLPKRVTLVNALDLILSGKQIEGKKAVKLGLADDIVAKQGLIALAKKNIKNGHKKKVSFRGQLESFASENFITQKIIFQKARKSVLKKTKGFYQAPLKILDVMEAGASKSRGAYLQMEAEAFGELCTSEQSKNLQHIFFMQDNAKKKRKGEKLKEVERGAVLGAGTMGGGIAWLFASFDQRPLMKDITVEALELGLKQSARNFKGSLVRKKMTQADYARKQSSIRPTLTYDSFQKVDLVIEAVVENMEVKKKVFSELEKKVTKECLITSNSSSLSITEMATAFENPERFAGLHFFNPVHLMPLVEIITHPKMSQETIDSLYNWVLAVKKVPVIVKDGPGYLVNRILMPFINEAAYLLEEGVSMKELDTACLNFGMPMGPCRLMDEVGIDVLVKVGKIMQDGLGERARPCELSKKIVEKNFFGKKNKKGFYVYDDEGKIQGENEELKAFLAQNKSMDERTIQMRVFLPMINEASMILSEGLVDGAATVDLGLVFGIGFPPFRGGLLRYADSEGLDNILKALEEFANTVNGNRYAPSAHLKKLVQNKMKFYDS